MHYNKGFSLIEFLVVVALIGVLSVFFYTPRTTKWNTEVTAAQSKIVSLLKYYQKKSMRDGVKYYVQMNQNVPDNLFAMEANVDNTIRSRQSNCTPSNNPAFLERRNLDPLENIRVVACEAGGNGCLNTSQNNTGICFFPNGSSASEGNRNEWYIFHSAGDNATHATNAHRFVVWRTTSFIETSICRGNATFANISQNTLSCTPPTWIEE